MRRKQYTAAKRAMDEYERNSGFVNADGTVSDGHETYYESKDYKLYTTVLIIAIVIFGYAGYRYYQNRKKEANKCMQELNAQYVSVLNAYRKAQEEISMLADSHADFAKKKEDEVKKYRRQIAEYMETKEAHEKWEENKMWLDVDEIISFHQYAKDVKKPTDKEWNILKKITGEKLPSFIQKLHSEKYGLTENEIKTAILIRLGFIVESTS